MRKSYMLRSHSKNYTVRKSVRKMETVRIRLDLVGKEATRFVALRNKRGLTQHTQLVRQLLKEAEEKELSEEELA